jgi:ADP-ribosylglycohydrolase
VLDSLARGEELNDAMSRMAGAIVKWAAAPQGGHRGPGNACLAGARRLAGGAPWERGGSPDAGGCGSVMRAYPLGLVFHGSPDVREACAVAQSILTHGAPIALAACAAMAHATASALAGDAVAVTVQLMEQSAAHYDRGTAALIARAARRAEAGEKPDTVLQELQGWAAHEAIAAATYVYVRHADDFAAAVLEGANAPGDSDSIATLAGALVGARCGTQAIPSDWLRDVERCDELSALAQRTLSSCGYPDWDALYAQLEALDRE